MRWDISFIIFFRKKIGKSLSGSTTGSSAGSGASGGANNGGGGGNGGGNGGGGGNSISGAGGGSLSGGGIVAVKQETPVELASLGHGSYTMVDSTTFLSSQQQRVNNPPEDDEVPSQPSMSLARCEAMSVSLCMSMSVIVGHFLLSLVSLQPRKLKALLLTENLHTYYIRRCLIAFYT